MHDDSLSASPTNPTGPESARTNAMIAECENDFNLMSGWFGNISLTVTTPISVNAQPIPPTRNEGASWVNPTGSPLTLTPLDASDAIRCRILIYCAIMTELPV